MQGGKISNLINNDNFYLINENYKNGSLGYSSFWTLSPSINYLGSDNISALDSSGNMNSMDRVSYDHYAFRPAVSLIPGIEIESGGTGTKANPYVIK